MSNSVLVNQVTKQYIREDLPTFNVGDNISVTYFIDGGRTQTFKGIVLSLKGAGVSRTFCVRKIGADNIGVEKILPLHSPIIKSIKVEKTGVVRKSKVYYMRNRIGKLAMKIKEGKKIAKVEEIKEVTAEVENKPE